MSNLFPVVAGYDLREIMGRGGEATIYEAIDKRHGRSVAVKVIDGPVFDDSQRRAFTRELRAMGRLGDHPHVVNVFDSGFTAAGRPFLVMPLLRKGTLSARVESHGPLAVGELLELGIKIGSALETAHRRGILHCDVKPNNLLIGPWDEPMLADFGISSITNIGLTSTNRLSLTVMYAAPEVLDDDPPTVASDIYSFGATLYTLVAGEPAYGGDSPASVMKNVLATKGTPRLQSSVPPGLVDLIAEMMDHDPSARPASAGQVVSRLQALQQQFGVAPTAAMIGGPIEERTAHTISREAATPEQVTPDPATPEVAIPEVRRSVPEMPAAPVVAQAISAAAPVSSPGLADPATRETMGRGPVAEPEEHRRGFAFKAAIGAVAVVAMAGLAFLFTRPDGQGASPAPDPEPTAVVSESLAAPPPATAEPTSVSEDDDTSDEATTEENEDLPINPVTELTGCGDRSVPPSENQAIERLRVDPTARTVVTFSGVPVSCAQGTAISLPAGALQDLAVLADGTIATAGKDNRLWLWDPTGEPGSPLEPQAGGGDHTDTVRAITELADGRIASASLDGTVRLWDMPNVDTSVALATTTPDEAFFSLEQLTDGSVAAGSATGRVIVWDLDEPASPSTLAVSPSGRTIVALRALPSGLLATGTSDGFVSLWDTALDDSAVEFADGRGGVQVIENMSANRLVIGWADGTIRVFNLDDPQNDITLTWGTTVGRVGCRAGRRSSRFRRRRRHHPSMELARAWSRTDRDRSRPHSARPTRLGRSTRPPRWRQAGFCRRRRPNRHLGFVRIVPRRRRSDGPRW